MKCRNCEAEIPPTFVKSIQENTCPACGEAIQSEEDLELLAELTSAMERMPNNPQGIAGWLVSNYKFVKIGDAKPVDKFYTGEVVSNSSNNNSNLTEFFKKTVKIDPFKEAQMKLKNEKDKKIASLAKNITQASIEDHMYGDGDAEIVIDEDNKENIDPSDLKFFSKVDENVEPDPEVYHAISNMLNSPTAFDKAVESDNMQQERMKRLIQQQTFKNGQGPFKR